MIKLLNFNTSGYEKNIKLDTISGNASMIYSNFSRFVNGKGEMLLRRATVLLAIIVLFVFPEVQGQENVKQEKEECLNELTSGLLTGKISKAVSKFNSSPCKKDFPEVSKMVNNLSNINKIVIDSFKDDIGKRIKVLLRNGEREILIKKVKKGFIYVEDRKGKVVMTKKYSVKNLNYNEVIKRLKAFDMKTAALVVGLKAFQRKKYNLAEKAFQKTGNLAIPLMAEFSKYKKTREKQIAAHKKRAKKEKVEEAKQPESKPIDLTEIQIRVKVKKDDRNLQKGKIGEHLRVILDIANETMQMLHGHGYSATVLLIGKSLVDGRKYNVITSFSKKIERDDKDEKSLKGIKKQYNCTNEYNAGGRVRSGHVDIIYPPSGYKYYSWLMVLKDSEGEIKLIDSKHSKFKKHAKKIMKYKSEIFDKSGNLVNAHPH